MMKLLAVVTTVSALALVACGDDSGTSATGTGGAGAGGSGQGGATTSAGGSGQGGASTSSQGGGSTGPDCAAACGSLYDCGVEDMNCPAFTGDAAEKTTFVDGCIPGCEAQPALAAIVDPTDCAGTIMTISGVSSDFASVCQGGISGAGGAGGGM
jgi:hypothetical protein